MKLVDRKVEIWKKILNPGTEFVYDTVIVLTGNEDITSGDITEDVKQVMSNFCPVFVGTPASDFSVIKPDNVPGWIVTCHYPKILVYVSPEDIQTGQQNDFTIGLYGRSKRDQDGRNPEVTYVEN